MTVYLSITVVADYIDIFTGWSIHLLISFLPSCPLQYASFNIIPGMTPMKLGHQTCLLYKSVMPEPQWNRLRLLCSLVPMLAFTFQHLKHPKFQFSLWPLCSPGTSSSFSWNSQHIVGNLYTYAVYARPNDVLFFFFLKQPMSAGGRLNYFTPLLLLCS